jgi:hypothetical protein
MRDVFNVPRPYESYEALIEIERLIFGPDSVFQKPLTGRFADQTLQFTDLPVQQGKENTEINRRDGTVDLVNRYTIDAQCSICS